MFSLEKFYDIVYDNLLRPLDINYMYFKVFGSTNPSDAHFIMTDQNDVYEPYMNTVVAYDQEPIFTSAASQIWDYTKYKNQQSSFKKWTTSCQQGLYHYSMKHFIPDFFVFANSEHSKEKNNFLKTLDNFHDWYYFYHGFAALDWFGNIPYRKPIKQYSRVFISFNNLYTEKRSYRLAMIAHLIDRGLDKRGYISMSQHEILKKITGELFDNTSLLHRDDKKLIYKTMLPTPPKLIIDTDDHHGALSANDDLDVLAQGLWHIVTETIYYDEKQHLTEKVFKPIVAKRPFILVAAPGNLAYLKSYGFQTFDRWIDESYDQESDPVKRMAMIVAEIEKLCNLPQDQLDTMYSEMSEILDHNFNWFYGGNFKRLIIDEMVDNFRRCLINHNKGRDSVAINYINHSHMDWSEIKQRLGY